MSKSPGSTKICKECGKEFSVMTFDLHEYAYKVSVARGVGYFCSYSCYNKYLNRIEEGRHRNGRLSGIHR